MVEADQALADERLAPRRLYCRTLDELWRVLRLGGSMPDRVNELIRLNRTQGVGQIMITDLSELAQRSARSNAWRPAPPRSSTKHYVESCSTTDTAKEAAANSRTGLCM